jgi:hypothetical protein
VKTVARKPPERAHSPTAANPPTFSVLSRQPTLSDGAQRTLSESANTTECDNTPTTEQDLLDRAQYIEYIQKSVAKRYELSLTFAYTSNSKD